MNITTQEKIKLFREIRGEDVYPSSEIRDAFYELLCPNDLTEMTLNQSTMAAAFYGYMLKSIGERFGMDAIDKLSTSVVRDFGYLKTKEYLQKNVPVHLDARGPGDVLMAALISTSNPEYKVEFILYDEAKTAIRLFGVCRYYRIASKLGIQSYLSLPIIKPWFEGVIEELKINCSIEVAKKFQHIDGRCEFHFTFQTLERS